MTIRTIPQNRIRQGRQLTKTEWLHWYIIRNKYRYPFTPEPPASEIIMDAVGNFIRGTTKPGVLAKTNTKPYTDRTEDLVIAFSLAVEDLAGTRLIFSMGSNSSSSNYTVRLSIKSDGRLHLQLRDFAYLLNLEGESLNPIFTAGTLVSGVLSIQLRRQELYLIIDGQDTPWNWINLAVLPFNLDWNQNVWSLFASHENLGFPYSYPIIGYIAVHNKFYNLSNNSTKLIFWDLARPVYPGIDGSGLFGQPARIFVAGDANDYKAGRGNNQDGFFNVVNDADEFDNVADITGSQKPTPPVAPSSNTPPNWVTTGLMGTLREDEVFRENISSYAVDAEFHGITYSILNSGNTDAIIENNQDLVVTNHVAGPLSIIIRALDDGQPRLSSDRTFSTIVEVSLNVPPNWVTTSLSGIPQETLQFTEDFNNYAIDPKGDPIIYSVVSGGGTNARFVGNILTIDDHVAGTLNLIIKASDNQIPPLSVDQGFTVNVIAQPNRPPVWNTTSFVNSIIEGTNFAEDLTNYAVDPDNDNISYSVIDNGGTNASVTGNILNITNHSTGVLTLTLRATDDGNPVLFSDQIFSATVLAPTNNPPIWNTINLAGSLTENIQFTEDFAGYATDPDGGTISYSITNNGGTDARFVGTVLTIDNHSQGTLNLTILATDNGVPNLATSQAFSATVAPPISYPTNVAPIWLTIALSGTPVVGTDFNEDLNGYAVDPDAGQTVTYTVVDSGGTDASIIGSILNITNHSAGSLTLVIRATDNGIPQLSSDITFNLTVTGTNNPPNWLITALAATPDETVQYTEDFTNYAVDPDGDNVSYSVQDQDGTDAAFTGNNLIMNTHTQGPLNLVIRATDDGSPPLFTDQAFAATVDPPPIAINPIPAITTQANNTGNVCTLRKVNAKPGVQNTNGCTVVYYGAPLDTRPGSDINRIFQIGNNSTGFNYTLQFLIAWDNVPPVIRLQAQENSQWFNSQVTANSNGHTMVSDQLIHIVMSMDVFNRTCTLMVNGQEIAVDISSSPTSGFNLYWGATSWSWAYGCRHDDHSITQGIHNRLGFFAISDTIIDLAQASNRNIFWNSSLAAPIKPDATANNLFGVAARCCIQGDQTEWRAGNANGVAGFFPNVSNSGQLINDGTVNAV